jgi:competence protein CoiA
MQIYAIDALGNLIQAQNAERFETYICPECGSRLRIRGGRLRKFHFFHLQPAQCRSHSKSLTHLHIQLILQKMLAPERVILEHRFPQIGRIADVVWPAKKIIFEVQVSPISAAEVKARNQDYKQMGYQVIWILHDRRFNRYRLTPAEAQLRFSTHYFTNINSFGKGFFYDQHSLVQAKKRIRRSRRFPIYFKNFKHVNEMQFLGQTPPERKKWKISFQGDLFHDSKKWAHPQKNQKRILALIVKLYYTFFGYLLEKASS